MHKFINKFQTFTSQISIRFEFSKLMQAIALFYIVTFFLFPDLSKFIFKVFLGLSFPFIFIDFKFFKKDPMFLLFVICLIVQTLSWLNSTFYFQEFMNSTPKLDRLSKLFSFIFLAYWMKGSVKLVVFTLCLYMLGLLLYIISLPNFLDVTFKLFLEGVRLSFGLKNTQYSSMLAGLSIIISTFLIFKENKKINIYKVCYLLCFLFFCLILFSSQSRQILLGLSVTVVVIFYMSFFKSVFTKKTTLLLVFTLSIVIYSFSHISSIGPRLKDTISTESIRIGYLFSGEHEKITSKGNGIRINSWLESLSWIKNSPIFGSGSNAIREVIEKSDKFTESQKKKFNHLHSFHLEILVAYGILGALVIYGMYYWLIRSLVLAHRENPELKMYTVLGICFLIFWIIINFFESFSSRSYGVYVHNIMFGCLYTFYFTQQRKKIEEAEACA